MPLFWDAILRLDAGSVKKEVRVRLTFAASDRLDVACHRADRIIRQLILLVVA